MTNRDFLTAIAENETLAAEVRAHASAALERMNAENEKRRNTESKARIANKPLVETIMTSILMESPITAKETAARLNDLLPELETPVTTQRASAILRQLAEDGLIARTELKEKGKTVKGYSLKAEEEQ